MFTSTTANLVTTLTAKTCDTTSSNCKPRTDCAASNHLSPKTLTSADDVTINLYDSTTNG